MLTKVDCEASVDALARTLGPSDLDDPRTVSLARGQVAALDQPAMPGQSPAGQCRLDIDFRGTDVCVAAVLESDGTTPVLMLAHQQWEASASGAFISCDSTNPPPSRCNPTLDPSVDPGFEAISLVVANGQEQFAVSDHAIDAKVRIASIDLAAVAARPPAPAGCRELRDGYHADLARTACTTHSDCEVVPALDLPGETPPNSCGAYLNRTAADDLRSTSQTFARMCQGAPMPCEAPAPPGCVNGHCAAVCVHDTLPYCPGYCTHYPDFDTTEGHACNTNVVCFAADDRRCHCAAETLTVTCAADVSFSTSCPYSCQPGPGYGDGGQPGYVDRSDAASGPPPDASAGDADATSDGRH